MAIVAVPVFSTIVQRGMVLIYKRDRTSFEGKMVYVKKVIDFIHDVFAVDHKMLRPIKFVAKYLFDNICPVSLFVYGLYTLQFPSIYFKITYLALAAIGIEFFNFVIFKFSKKSAYLYGEYNEMLDKSVKDGHCEASYLEENLCEIGFSPMRYISVIFKYLNKDSFDQGCFIRDRRKAFEGNYMDASISEKCIKESGSSPFTREKVSLVYERYVAGEKKYDKKIKKLLKRLKSINGVSFDLGSQSKLYRNPLDFKGKFSDLLKSLKLMPKTREEQLECLQKVSQCIQLIIDENYVFQKFEAYRVFSNSNLENLSKMIESIHEIPQLEEERRSLETIQEAFDRIAHLEGILEGFEEEKACATQRGEPLQFSELQSRILQYDNIGLIDPSVEDIETLKSLIQEHKKDMKQAFKRSVLNIRKKISDFKSYQEMLLISYEVEFYIFCLHRDGILFDKVDSLLEAIQSNSTKIIEELKGSFPPNISEELEEIFHQKRDRVTAFSEENIREMIRQIPQSLEEDLSQNIHKAMHSLNMEIREDLYGIVRGFKGVLPESIMHSLEHLIGEKKIQIIIKDQEALPSRAEQISEGDVVQAICAYLNEYEVKDEKISRIVKSSIMSSITIISEKLKEITNQHVDGITEILLEEVDENYPQISQSLKMHISQIIKEQLIKTTAEPVELYRSDMMEIISRDLMHSIQGMLHDFHGSLPAEVMDSQQQLTQSFEGFQTRLNERIDQLMREIQEVIRLNMASILESFNEFINQDLSQILNEKINHLIEELRDLKHRLCEGRLEKHTIKNLYLDLDVKIKAVADEFELFGFNSEEFVQNATDLINFLLKYEIDKQQEAIDNKYIEVLAPYEEKFKRRKIEMARDEFYDNVAGFSTAGIVPEGIVQE